MKKIVGLFITILLSSFPVFAKDMRFIQVTDTYFSQYDKTTVNRLENLVNEINSEKNVEFVVFTGNNIAKPKTEDVENFVKIANKLNTPYYIVLGNKDVNKLRRYVTEKGKILPRRQTGVCAAHQRALTTAIKRARFMALLPYVGD